MAVVRHLAVEIGPRHGTSAEFRQAAAWVAGEMRRSGLRRTPTAVRRPRRELVGNRRPSRYVGERDRDTPRLRSAPTAPGRGRPPRHGPAGARGRGQRLRRRRHAGGRRGGLGGADQAAGGVGGLRGGGATGGRRRRPPLRFPGLRRGDVRTRATGDARHGVPRPCRGRHHGPHRFGQGVRPGRAGAHGLPPAGWAPPPSRTRTSAAATTGRSCAPDWPVPGSAARRTPGTTRPPTCPSVIDPAQLQRTGRILLGWLEPTRSAESPEALTIAVAGDVHFEGALRGRLDRPATALAPATSTLAAADLAIINLETSLGTGGRPEPGKRYTFQAPPTGSSPAPRRGGHRRGGRWANNHALDYGRNPLAGGVRAARCEAAPPRAGNPPLAVVGIGRACRARRVGRGPHAPRSTAPSLPRSAPASPTRIPRRIPPGQWAATVEPSARPAARRDALDPARLLRTVGSATRWADVVVVVPALGGVQGERCPTGARDDPWRQLSSRRAVPSWSAATPTCCRATGGWVRATWPTGWGTTPGTPPRRATPATGVLTYGAHRASGQVSGRRARARVTDAVWEGAESGAGSRSTPAGGRGPAATGPAGGALRGGRDRRVRAPAPVSPAGALVRPGPEDVDRLPTTRNGTASVTCHPDTDREEHTAGTPDAHRRARWRPGAEARPSRWPPRSRREERQDPGTRQPAAARTEIGEAGPHHAADQVQQHRDPVGLLDRQQRACDGHTRGRGQHQRGGSRVSLGTTK